MSTISNWSHIYTQLQSLNFCYYPKPPKHFMFSCPSHKMEGNGKHRTVMYQWKDSKGKNLLACIKVKITLITLSFNIRRMMNPKIIFWHFTDIIDSLINIVGKLLAGRRLTKTKWLIWSMCKTRFIIRLSTNTHICSQHKTTFIC